MVASEVPQDLILPDKDTQACSKFNYEWGGGVEERRDKRRKSLKSQLTDGPNQQKDSLILLDSE